MRRSSPSHPHQRIQTYLRILNRENRRKIRKIMSINPSFSLSSHLSSSLCSPFCLFIPDHHCFRVSFIFLFHIVSILLSYVIISFTLSLLPSPFHLAFFLHSPLNIRICVVAVVLGTYIFVFLLYHHHTFLFPLFPLFPLYISISRSRSRPHPIPFLYCSLSSHPCFLFFLLFLPSPYLLIFICVSLLFSFCPPITITSLFSLFIIVFPLIYSLMFLSLSLSSIHTSLFLYVLVYVFL